MANGGTSGVSEGLACQAPQSQPPRTRAWHTVTFHEAVQLGTSGVTPPPGQAGGTAHSSQSPSETSWTATGTSAPPAPSRCTVALAGKQPMLTDTGAVEAENWVGSQTEDGLGRWAQNSVVAKAEVPVNTGSLVMSRLQSDPGHG